MKKAVTSTLKARIPNIITLITQTAWYISRTRRFCDISPTTELVCQDMSWIYHSLANYLSYSPTQETDSLAYDVNRKKSATCTYFHLQEALCFTEGVNRHSASTFTYFELRTISSRISTGFSQQVNICI